MEIIIKRGTPPPLVLWYVNIIYTCIWSMYTYCCPACAPRWRNINENARSLIDVYGYRVLVRLVNVADQRVGDHEHAIRFGRARRHRERFLKSSPLTPNGVHPAKRHFFQWKTCVLTSGRLAGGGWGPVIGGGYSYRF